MKLTSPIPAGVKTLEIYGIDNSGKKTWLTDSMKL
jgi:hypothetical protein